MHFAAVLDGWMDGWIDSVHGKQDVKMPAPRSQRVGLCRWLWLIDRNRSGHFCSKCLLDDSETLHYCKKRWLVGHPFVFSTYLFM